ncbi:MAG: hypothetical protein HN726_03730 [Candidatus Magasanikbacteria bacterium]|jgi:hypothetical protein|nr:hypothetical protein [Candidatus Magasanikbacteria bacterium]MBT4221234.1 hypothetical protein [Candidatus Magasanikbacteria bacterium]MBT4350663.1 hypothetical protein [Candidatus Magasanikbacteria bacterium]MBT4541337.1 hypothetical protein [Candidatus Magasanikbacteria bacterium]MBT6253071.1 hypothetical protein [Candidatus Magasanikbacteria bacterium]
MKFLISVDTEADYQRSSSDPLTLENIPGLSRFQALCDSFGFTPTYFITHEVAVNKEAASMLRSWQEKGTAEIGAHLHPWTTPPKEEKDVDLRFPSDVSTQSLQAKLEVLTAAVTDATGVSPTSYRAGRWGFDNRQAEMLSSLGYIVDSSITPKISWKKTIGDTGGNGGPDFRFSSTHPYVVEGKGKNILELPMTVLFTGMYSSVRGILGKIFLSLPRSLFITKVLNKLFFRLRWFRVFDRSVFSDWDALYTAAKKNDLPYIQFMIHSSELSVGTSPYTKTPEALEHVYTHIEYIFTLLSKYNVESMSISSYAQSYKKI